MKQLSGRHNLNRGFARTDAMVAVLSLFLIGGVAWAGTWIGGEKHRIWTCENHLKQLGQAFSSYIQDHGGALPVGFYDDGKSSNSWDSAVAVYLQPKSSGTTSPEKSNELAAKVAPIFRCPSDPGPRGDALARSYAMPIYDINKAGWPPEAESMGGLGLYLDTRTLKKAYKAMADEPSKTVPAIKSAMVPAPADTALLVERITSGNHLFEPKFATVASVGEQFEIQSMKAGDFHGGRMNYLMLDGHVELLWPVQSGGHVGSGDQGLWTIRPGD